MRLLPRRTRHQWIIFLLLVCLIGVFLTYKSLSDSEKHKVAKHVKHSHQYLQTKSSDDPKLPIHPEVLAESHSNDDRNVEVKFPKPAIDDSIALHNLRNLENDDDYVTDDEKNARLKILLKELSTTDWKTAKDADEMMILVKSEFSDLDIDSKMSCREIDNLRPGSSRGYGSFYGKKNVDPVRMGYDKDFTIKSVGVDTELKIECLKQDYNHDRCSVMGNYRLMKELIFMVMLQTSSVIKLEGFCLRGETVDPRIAKKGALILTESSRPAGLEGLSSFSWHQKLQIAQKMVGLLEYLENSPIGSLGFEKLHLPDFVMVGDELKLVDLDNLMIGEKSCKTSSDCTIPEMTRKAIPCSLGQCRGRNALNNLLWMYRTVLLPLMRYPPGASVQRDVEGFMEKIQNLEVTTRDVAAQLKEWLRDSLGGGIVNDPQREPPPRREQTMEERNRQLPRNQYVDRNGIVRHKNPDQYVDLNGELKWKPPPQDIPNQAHQEEVKEKYNPGEYEYERVPNANFPGLHDFSCTQSRVSWGCVVSVRTLRDAKSLCDNQENCESFVIFSSNPDIDAIMTVVMKNSAAGKPDPNYGATLFRKKKYKFRNDEGVGAVDVVAQQPAVDMVAEQPAVVGMAAVTSKSKAQVDSYKACLKKALNVTQSARASRERRLMTHLGLKGIEEDEWLTYAESVQVNKYLGPSEVTSKPTYRARFRFTFEDNTLGLKRGEFIHETGPLYYHIGYLITYHLDRILGLYHTPPTIARTFSKGDLERIRGDSKWKEDILPKLLDDISEPSLLSVPVPSVMKAESMAIADRENLVPSVQPFTRNQKVHLEYQLLASLAKLSQPQYGYMGYKGHLIHFEADLAFNNLKRSLIGYFYHCQFPNSVFKTLVCYKCSDSNRMPRICGLGEEVINRMARSGFGADKIKIGSMIAGEITQSINNNAAIIMTVLDQCIKKFGRENVLY